MRLRMICQSWKVMFQAEYSSGSPLRMLVDLKASVEHALGRGKSAEAPAKAKPGTGARVPIGQKPVATKVSSPASKTPQPGAAKAAAAASGPSGSKPIGKAVNSQTVLPKATAKPPAAKAAAPEFEVSGSSDWDANSAAKPPKKK